MHSLVLDSWRDHLTDRASETDQSNFSSSSLWGHGGTGPGEHQPAGQVRVPLGPSEAGLVRSRVYHAEVSAGGRTAQLPLGFPEGRRSDHGPQRGAGEESLLLDLKQIWAPRVLV